MNIFQRIATSLSVYQPNIYSETDKTQAAVAAVFHLRRDDLYLLFIERAAHPTDPWSGHIAFPGGTAEPDDPDLKYTAERETREELGLDSEQRAVSRPSGRCHGRDATHPGGLFCLCDF